MNLIFVIIVHLKFTFFIVFQMLSMADAEDTVDEDTSDEDIADEEVTVAAAVVTEVFERWFQC